ncbi:uncharacterized protein Z519_05813 [Cladophialophora bantiana CBS 173.52]|uniref:Cell wall protein PhiA n=1 Tax=Cladophialophora bantiana (strain ATCC 10958 / CBS 173.52 / CDC B-1940 / NIH 8579) TaxID=1442370 RepID=A0A0D2HIT6_CLAB1|nr:uncharacterized protein Z519_05813 [Cladophialophora bantiana CBS 173.52]KIW93208.1 hypothetical protein Z519_05813 [Cladophialophora bantiana CBS 173.52]
MFLLSAPTAALALFSATSAVPLVTIEKRQAVDGTFGLGVGDSGLFDLDEVQTFKFSYANNSAYFGQIKYQQYSEPLVMSGAKVAVDTEGGLTFLSIHSAPTGWQNGYIQPNKTAPFQFSIAHAGGNIPADAVSTGFSFSGGGGPLLWNGENKFWACQSPELQALSTYQIWWKGAGEFPLGVDCKGPIGADMIDGCQRGN